MFPLKNLIAYPKVYVYKNNHKNCYSLRSYQTRKVIDWKKNLVLKNAKFKVSQSGRKRVLKEKRKNIHAGIEGWWDQSYNFNIKDLDETHKIFYNPYKTEYFLNKNGEKIEKAKIVFLTEVGVYAYGQQYIKKNRQPTKDVSKQ